MIYKLYSLAHNKDEIYAAISERFKRLKMKDSNLNYLCTAIEEMPRRDFNGNMAIAGFARTGKGTLVTQMFRKYHYIRFNGEKSYKEVDAWLIRNKYAQRNFIYSDQQDLTTMFKEITADMFASDESYYVADKRETMHKRHIKSNQTINAFASLNNFYIDQIQNLSDLEFRHINNSNLIDVIIERGRALCYSSEHSFAIVKSFFGFEKFEKEPGLLSNFERGVYAMKRLRSYINENHWKSLDDCLNCDHVKHGRFPCANFNKDREICGCNKYKCKNPFFAEILEQKEYWHAQAGRDDGEDEEEEEVIAKPEKRLKLKL